MAEFDYEKLKAQYGDFEDPYVRVRVEGQELNMAKLQLSVTDLELDMTSGFEASLATFRLVGIYDRNAGSFQVDKVKNMILLGSALSIAVGYGAVTREVFRGFIARVHFLVPAQGSNDMPAVEITAMDAKAAMMANRHSLKLKATNWADAVREITDKNPFLTMNDFENSSTTFIETEIGNTPDKKEGEAGGGGAGGGAGGQQQTTDKRMEMVEESDYEFIVKAARKFNFRFFSVGNKLYFTPQEKKNNLLIEISPSKDVLSLDVGYDMTGLVKKVEVRTLDLDQGKLVNDSRKSTAKISLGSKAKNLVDKQNLVYLDPTAENKEEAGYRADYLLNQTAFRLGSIEAVFKGLPEFTPGRYISLKGFGKPVDNQFYLTRVRHIFDDAGYRTEIEGQADTIQT